MSKFNDQLFQKAFGEQLAKLRTKHNISRRQLAFEIESEEKQLRLIESGESSSGIKWVGRIASVLDIAPAELFDFEMPKIYDTSDSDQ